MNTPREQLDGLRRGARAHAGRRVASSWSQAPSEARDARPERIPPSSALRWASAREYSLRSAARAGHRAATSWSMCERRSAGGPFDQLQAIRQEHAHQRPEAELEDPLDAGAVGAHPLRRLGGAGAPRRSRRPARGARRRRAAARSRASPGRRSAPARARCASAGSVPCSRSRCASSRLLLPAPLGPWTTLRPSRRGCASARG